MQLRRSQYLHAVAVGEGRSLLVHAISHLRLVVDQNVAQIVRFFAETRTFPEDFPDLKALVPGEDAQLIACVSELLDRGVLTPLDPETEASELERTLAASYGRDPAALLDKHRREARQGPEAYWATGAAQGLNDLAGQGRRVEIILFGDCDVHMEADFLRQEAGRRGIDLRVAATFPDDLDFAAEHPHDAVLIGALRSRHAIAGPVTSGEQPYAGFINEADRLVRGLRGRTAKPILIDNIPEPTVEPLGIAERGVNGHRNRFRLANVALSQLTTEHADVHAVDLASVFSRAGSDRLVDDAQVGFTHFGSPGWMLQRGEEEKRAVHGIFPDTAPLSAAVLGDPYGREKVAARAHLDLLQAVLGDDRKKCVVVDLDGVLWPGVLAETGAPFAWSPEISGTFSYIGLFFGIHEALLCLKRRGVLLACVSKNDEEVVRALWRYPDHYPHERLLHPDDFVTWRVNWRDKAENIVSIAAELGFAEGAFLFIDDHPVERDRVRTRLPAVETWGEELFSLRRRLLTDPRLQTALVTDESAGRTDLVKAQLGRRRLQDVLPEADYLASLDVESAALRLSGREPMDRLEELLQRTTQFNATGLRLSRTELAALADGSDSHVIQLQVRDRFGDHGTVGVAAIREGEIVALAVSCRVLGLGAERSLMDAAIAAVRSQGRLDVRARIVETDRNHPVRNVYRDAGFTKGDDGVWRLGLGESPVTA